MYNGRDGVVTDDNGLIYMRARYYSPELRRFVNADILVGDIADSTSLNRYSYVNGNPVSFTDPLGLSKDNRGNEIATNNEIIYSGLNALYSSYEYFDKAVGYVNSSIKISYAYLTDSIKNTPCPKRTPKGSWILKNRKKLDVIEDTIGSASKISKTIDILSSPWVDSALVGVETTLGIVENIQNDAPSNVIIADAATNILFGAGEIAVGVLAGKLGATIGTAIAPGVGTVVGGVVGALVGIAGTALYTLATEEIPLLNDKTLFNTVKDGLIELFEK